MRTAQNGLASALLQHTTSRLVLLGKLGLLRLDERGRLQELARPAGFRAIESRYPDLTQEG